jgi:hypothetical protein
LNRDWASIVKLCTSPPFPPISSTITYYDQPNISPSVCHQPSPAQERPGKFRRLATPRSWCDEKTEQLLALLRNFRGRELSVPGDAVEVANRSNRSNSGI